MLSVLMQVVAAGKFCDRQDIDGFPDVVVLTSDLKEQRRTDPDTGYRYRYNCVEFAAIWLDPKDKTKNGTGISSLQTSGTAFSNILYHVYNCLFFFLNFVSLPMVEALLTHVCGIDDDVCKLSLLFSISQEAKVDLLHFHFHNISISF